ncbi:MAG TPA: hypothetical protein VFH61_05150, partial [Thermoleophilia bacterium]|nr:hypothetical protein [Thermoleophilia bacterium]
MLAASRVRLSCFLTGIGLLMLLAIVCTASPVRAQPETSPSTTPVEMRTIALGQGLPVAALPLVRIPGEAGALT